MAKKKLSEKAQKSNGADPSSEAPHANSEPLKLIQIKHDSMPKIFFRVSGFADITLQDFFGIQPPSHFKVADKSLTTVDGQEFHADVCLEQIPPGSKKPTAIIVFEHQSTFDRKMPMRMFAYSSLFCLQSLKNNPLKEITVYQILFQVSKTKRYTHAKHYVDLSESCNPSEAASGVASYFIHYLINAASIPESRLSTLHVAWRLFVRVMMFRFRKDVPLLEQALEDVMNQPKPKKGSSQIFFGWDKDFLLSIKTYVIGLVGLGDQTYRDLIRMFDRIERNYHVELDMTVIDTLKKDAKKMAKEAAEEAALKTSKKTALNMLKDKVKTEIIKKYTGLSEKAIEALKSQLPKQAHA